MSFFTLIVIGAALFIAFKVWSKNREPHPPNPRPKTLASERASDWLEERWSMSQQPEYATRLFAPWYFDPITDAQANRLEQDGRAVNSGMTKGQASDLIGLGMNAEESDLEILRFFKKPVRGMNQTRARHEVSMVFLGDQNRAAWEARPASARTREFFKFLGLKVEPGMQETTAQALKKSTEAELTDSGDNRIDQWHSFSNVLEEFDDSEFRSDYDIKKPTPKQVRSVIDLMLAEGKTWDDLEMDAGDIAERLLQEFPTLAK